VQLCSAGTSRRRGGCTTTTALNFLRLADAPPWLAGPPTLPHADEMHNACSGDCALYIHGKVNYTVQQYTVCLPQLLPTLLHNNNDIDVAKVVVDDVDLLSHLWSSDQPPTSKK
jgi:hypothetical protein